LRGINREYTGYLRTDGSDLRESSLTEITVTGTLSKGKTTAIVTYLIADTATNTLVGMVALPNAHKPKTAVSLTLKVPKPGASFTIGTFMSDLTDSRAVGPAG
jgi:hypothetical protein